MKKTLLALSILVCAAFTGHAVIPTLTQANSAPAPGDVITVYLCDTTGVSQGSAGANQTWTINTTINTGQVSTANVVTAASTAYTSSFQGANVAAYYPASSTYQYFGCSSTGVIQWGTGSSSIIQTFDAPGISFFSYPFTYNTVASSPSVTGTHSYGTMSGSNTCTGDGYETLVLNGKTYSNVLRQKQDQTIDYYYTSSGHIISHIVSYFWYDGIHKTPIIEIVTQDNSGLTTSYSKFVYAGSFVTGIEEASSAKLNLDVYPNPAHGEVHLSFNPQRASDAMVNIYNSTGTLVRNQNLDIRNSFEATETLDIRALSQGIYMIEVVAGEARTTRRIVVE